MLSSTLKDQLRSDVYHLAETIGERNARHPKELERAAQYLERQFANAGFEPKRQTYTWQGQSFANIEVILASVNPNNAKTLVIGGHYDSVIGTVGANDNATGVAAVLALARHFAKRPQALNLRFVAFVNEEPPFFQSEGMGSVRYARMLKEQGIDVVGMMSLETIGYYSKEPGSQKYPGALSALYPNTGHFISFVANETSAPWLNQIYRAYSRHAVVPGEKGVFPEALPGVGWSDHWAFWRESYPALMVTDTAPYRYPHYHTKEDTPDKVDYENLSAVTASLIAALEEVLKEAPKN